MDDKLRPFDADPEALAQLQKLAELGLMTSALLHEIRQPLAAIKGYGQMLREGCDEPAAGRIDLLLGQVERLERLATNHRRLLQRDGPRTRLDLCAVCASAARLLEPRARQAAAELTLRLPDTPVFVEAAEGQLLQVLVNLLSNALDAVAGCPRRAVELRLVPGERPEIVVADSGAGVPPGLASRLFTPFFTTKGPESGTGLGLFVSRRLAEVNGARLELAAGAELAVPFKTAFRLRFGPDEPAARPARRAVLVVDDEEVVCSMLANLLEPEGLEVQQALTGDEALELLARRSFDLVLCDKNLPGKSGLEVARAVRQRQPSCPVILMTGYPSLETAQEGLEVGLLDYLEKPFDDIAEVRRRVREALQPSEKPAARPRTRRVLVIEDRQDEAVRFGEAITLAGGLPIIARGVEEGLAQLAASGADAVIVSLDLRDRALSPEKIRALRKSAAGGLIAIGDHPSLEQTISAIRLGAAACLPRALTSPEKLSRELARLLRPG